MLSSRHHRIFSPGEITQFTGPYDLCDAGGRLTGARFWLNQGHPAPPTPAPGWRWRWTLS